MPWRPSASQAVLAALGVVSLLPLLQMVRGGLWEPWELSRAEAARVVADGEQAAYAVPEVHGEGERPPLATWVTAAGFSVGGSEVGMGKAAVAVFLVLCAVFSMLLLRPFAGTEVTILGFVVFFSTPLVFFQGASAGGDGVALGAYAVAFAALTRLLERGRSGASGGGAGLRLLADLAAAAAGLVLSYFALGGVVGVMLPVAASALACLIGHGLGLRELLGGWKGQGDPAAAALRLAACVAAVALVVWFAVSVLAHQPDEKFEQFTLAVGGAKAIHPLETFEVLLSRLAYALFPWCVFVPVAIAWLAVPADGSPSEAPPAPEAEPAGEPLGRHAALHLLLAYPMLAYWSWRFYPAPAVLAFPMAILVGRYLSGVSVSGGRALRLAGAVAAFLAIVVLRDAYAFPKDFLAVIGFPGAGDIVTDNPAFSMALAGATLMMIGVIAVTHASSTEERRSDLLDWYARQRDAIVGSVRGLLSRAARPSGWNTATAVVTIASYAAGALAWLALLVALLVARYTESTKLTLTHFGVWVVVALLALPFAVVLADLGWRGAWRVGRMLSAPMGGAVVAAGGLAVSLVFGFAVAPSLDKGFSLGPAAEAAEAQGDISGALALFQVEDAATNYYPSLAGGKPVATVDEAADWLASAPPGRMRYLVLPSRNAVLNDINLRYRKRSGGRLMPVISDPSARYLLAASELPQGMTNRSSLAEVIMAAGIRPMYPILESSFEGKVEYLGYDINSYPDGTVAALQDVTITHYWKCTGEVSGDYQVFVHVDGMGDRINGDHAPAGGIFPTRYWQPGDVVADVQHVRIPFFVRPARDPMAYRIYVGLFRGESRMKLTKGTGDDNRLWGGVLRVR